MHAHTFRHEMLAYTDGVAGFARRVLPLISTALADERPVLVAVPPERVALLQEGLGEDRGRVELLDMHLLGRNPGRIISAWHEFLARRSESVSRSGPGAARQSSASATITRLSSTLLLGVDIRGS